jgi:uncharacterized protein YrrD
MRQKITELKGFSISTADGDIGKVKDFYFDDDNWMIRYFIVETGTWLFGRKVLIAPQAIEKPDWENNTLLSNLTKEQVKSSPDIDTDIPVSRQQELELYKHYPWGNHWAGGLWASGVGTTGMMMPVQESIEPKEQKENDTVNETQGDPNLRSTDKVTGYHIKATDGRIGDVEDFIIDADTWKIKFLLVDTGNWFPGKKVIIAPQWIKEIKWEVSEVTVNATVEQVKNSPEYQSNKYLDDGYEQMLTNYYGRFITRK